MIISLSIEQKNSLYASLITLIDKDEQNEFFSLLPSAEDQKMTRHMIQDGDNYLRYIRSSLFRPDQILLIMSLFHLYVALKNKSIKTDEGLKKLRTEWNVSEQFSHYIYHQMKRINPTLHLETSPLATILTPNSSLLSWAETSVKSALLMSSFLKTKRNILKTLKVEEYEHPLDKTARAILESTLGLETLIKKFNEHALERLIKTQFTGSNIKVSQTDFPELFEAYRTACETLDMSIIPDLYIKQGFINACTLGVNKPIIVIDSGCCSLLTYDELVFVLGHELGHVKSKHVLYYQMAEIFPILGDLLGAATLGIGKLAIAGLQVALLNWRRKSEFTADRAGMLACQNKDAVISAMMKLAGLPIQYFNRVTTERFLQQAREFEELDEDMMNKAAKVMSVILADHPWTVQRAHEIDKWVSNKHYVEILNKRKPVMNPYCYLSPNLAVRISPTLTVLS